jgi:hypothetical protein
MKDSEARGLVLRQLYDLRHQIDYVNQSDLENVPIERKVMPSILKQLADKNLIAWNLARGGMGSYFAYMAQITAFGIDVVEGTAQAPIAVTIDSSVHVLGSQNVQVGGQGTCKPSTWM